MSRMEKGGEGGSGKMSPNVTGGGGGGGSKKMSRDSKHWEKWFPGEQFQSNFDKK
jgi:hypothetical protein